MARRSTGLQFAIHFRARHTDPTGERKLALRNSGSGDLRSPAFDNFIIASLARFGGRH